MAKWTRKKYQVCIWPRKHLPDSPLLSYSQQLQKWELVSAGGGFTSLLKEYHTTFHRCKWESSRNVHFLFFKCKSYICNNPMPKPTAAPPNECLFLCLPLCLHPQHTGILSFTPSPVCFLSLSNQPQRRHITVLTIVGPFVPDLEWILAQFPLICRSDNQGHLAVASSSWISKGNLHPKTLIKSPSFLCFQGEEVGNLWGSWKRLQFGEATPPLLIYIVPDIDQSRGSPAEQGDRPYSLLSFTPEKRFHWICTPCCFYCWKSLKFISLLWLLPYRVMALHILAPHKSAGRQRLSMTGICPSSISRELLSAIVERNKEWKCPNVYNFLQHKIQNMFLVIPQDRLFRSTTMTDVRKSASDRTSRKSQTQIRAKQVCTSLNKTELKLSTLPELHAWSLPIPWLKTSSFLVYTSQFHKDCAGTWDVRPQYEPMCACASGFGDQCWHMFSEYPGMVLKQF